jgi:hypothetical protein
MTKLIALPEAQEAELCAHVARLELSGDNLAANILRHQFDLDDVWIEDFKIEYLENQPGHSAAGRMASGTHA